MFQCFFFLKKTLQGQFLVHFSKHARRNTLCERLWLCNLACLRGAEESKLTLGLFSRDN